MTDRFVSNVAAGLRVLVVVAVLLGAAGCVAYGALAGPPRAETGSGATTVPRESLPPPGMCRIWYPDRPVSQQPPPGDCAQLRDRVPPGARLIRG